MRVAALALAACIASGCGPAAGSPGDSRQAAAVRRATVEDVFLLTGEVQAVRSQELAVPRAEGGRFQIRWMVEDGTEVEAGQPVMEFDNAQVAQRLEERRLRLVQAQIALEGREASLEADIAQKRLELERAEVEVEKARIEAAVPQELRSRKEWHEKQQLLRSGEAALERARLTQTTLETTGKADLDVQRVACIKAAREVETAERSLSDLILRAPRPGVVLLGRSPQEDRALQVGDNVFSGWRVASIPDLSSMQVVAYLAEVDEGRVAPGQAVRVILDAHPDKRFRGRVEYIAAVAQDVRYLSGFRVLVSLADPDPALLRPGFSTRVEVVRRVFQDALLVPRSAVTRDGSAYRTRQSRSAPLELAACLPLECVVTAGLSEGDRVALR